MKLALAEMRRRPGRWGSVIGAVGFIVFLVLVLAALADGLFIGTAGALATGDSDALVYSIDGRRSLVRSELPMSDIASVAGVDGVADVGGLGVLLTTAGTGTEAYDVAVMGHIPGHAGEPKQFVEGRRPSVGEQFVGVADVSIQEAGVSLGDSVTLTDSSQPVEIIGFVENAQYLLAPTVWVPLETWQALRLEARPETAGRGPVVQAIPILVKRDLLHGKVVDGYSRTFPLRYLIDIPSVLIR
jgi:putative ABC transport system permease protein